MADGERGGALRAHGVHPALEVVGLPRELGARLTGDRSWLLGIAVNLALALGYLAFTRYHPDQAGPLRLGNVGVAVVVWVLADVITTNQLGADADRVLGQLSRGHRVAGVLVLRNLTLAVVLVPLAIAATLLSTLLVDDPPPLLHALTADVGAVFLWLGVGSVVSVLLPYRPIPLRRRWRARSTWVRWGICLGTPYVLAVTVIPLLHAPLQLFSRRGAPSGPANLAWTWGYLVLGLAYWLLGVAVAARLARRPRHDPRRRLRATADTGP